MGKLLPLAVFPAAYMFGAFIAWDFDPADWEPSGRALLSLVSAAVFLVLITP